MDIRAIAMAVLLAMAGLAPAAGAEGNTKANADANATAAVNNPKDLVHELLDMSAPAPDWRRAVKVIPWGQVPPDDAPIEVLLAFWSYEAGARSPSLPLYPSAGVQSRLLDAVIKKPRRFPSYEWLLPETPEAVANIKAAYDKLTEPAPRPASASAPQPGSAPVDPVQELRRQIHNWLLTRSLYFRDELIRDATNARFDGYLIGLGANAALARLDWSAAEPLLNKHAAGSEPHVAAAAMALLYEHADKTGNKAADELRQRLRGIVEDRKALGFVRDHAFKALMSSAWPGRDEWLLSRFTDATLMDLREGSYVYRPLRDYTDRDPNHWIPILTKMVSSRDRAVHDNAVSCLIECRLLIWPPRKDTLVPLLPWLSDPNWSSAYDRRRLISALSYVYLPESVPGLLRMLRSEKGEAQYLAAEALGRYRVKEAGPDIRKLLEKAEEALAWPGDSYDERRFVPVLQRATWYCSAITDEQIARQTEARAREIMADPNQGPFREGGIFAEGRPHLPNRAERGWLRSVDDDLRRDKELRQEAFGPAADRVAETLLMRGRELGQAEPNLAENIVVVLLDSPAPAVDRELIRLLGRTRSVTTVLSALYRCEEMRKNVPRELAEMVRAGGPASGIAAAVLAEPETCLKLLRGKDKPAKLMLLACARLIRTALTVEDVAALWTPDDALLALATERYLECEDSLAARKIVWAHHPGEVLILGGPDSFEPLRRHPDFPGDIREPEYEKRLRKEMQEPNRPDEIIAMITGSAGGGRGNWIIRRKGNQHRLTFEPPPNWDSPGQQKKEGSWSRELTKDEARWLADTIVKGRFDDLPAIELIQAGGTYYTYLHLAAKGGRRVFLMAPTYSDAATTPYGLMVRFFEDLDP